MDEKKKRMLENGSWLLFIIAFSFNIASWIYSTFLIIALTPPTFSLIHICLSGVSLAIILLAVPRRDKWPK